MTFSCLNIKKIWNPGIVTIRRTFIMRCANLSLHGSKKSWNRYHPEDFLNEMCQHSHYTRVRNPGIATIRRTFGMRCANTRTTWDKCGFWRELPPHERGILWREGFCRELPAHRQGIHTRKGIPPGITSLFTQKSLER
jgi:hypothetical protein